MFGFAFKNYCSLLDVPTSQSPAGLFWQATLNLWTDFWPYILGFLALIVISELLTRHKNPYNSANGFTPDFNRLVGSLSYMLLQLLLYFSIYLIVGNIAYCFPWPYAAHALVFSLNFAILHGIGFWSEKPKPKRWQRRRKW
jgi:hypothetical protein